MPTKTLRRGGGGMGMSNPTPPPPPPPLPPHGYRQRRRLWTEIPMEERVHVQGIPSGDPCLFGGGLSSVFGPELWKCSGYVPKKFDFQYKEFSCWAKENDNLANDGAPAAVQLLLSKEKVVLPNDSASLGKVVLLTDSASLGGGAKRQVERQVEETDARKKKQGECKDLDVRSTPQNGVKKKDRSSLHPTVSHYGKHKKEDTQTSKDVSGKKKVRVIHNVEDSKKKSPHASKSVSTLSCDAKQLEFYEGRGLKVDKNVTQSGKHENSKDTVPADPSSKGFLVMGHDVDDSKNTPAFSGQTPKGSSCVVSTHSFSIKARMKDENGGLTEMLQMSPKICDVVQPALDHNDPGSLPAKDEDVGFALENANENGGCSSRSEGIDLHKPEHTIEDLKITAPQVKDSQNDQDSNGDMSITSLHQNKAQFDSLNFGGGFDIQSSPPCDGKLYDMETLSQHPANYSSENVKMEDTVMGILQFIDHKVNDVGQSTVVADGEKDKVDGAPSESCQFRQQLAGSESSMIARESSSELNKARPTEEPSKSGDTILSPSEWPSPRKIVVSFAKSSSNTSTILFSKSSASDSRRAPDAQNYNCSTNQKEMSEYKISSKNDNSSSAGFVKDRDRHEKPKKMMAKEPSKSSASNKFLHSSVSMRTLSEPKEAMGFSSAKTSVVQNIATIPSSGESASYVQTESALDVENKTTASGSMRKSEEANHSSCQPSAKVNHTPQMHHSAASNAPTMLSDEELALLLHQELNSSPRVPRVPRMRHAGSLPQLASPTGTSMLMKRTSSSSGGKDHGLVFKRKGKNLIKEGSPNSRELRDELKNANRSPLLPVLRTNDSARAADSVTKREAESINKSIPRASSLTTGSVSLASTETNERNMSSARNSPRNGSDDDTGGVVRPTHLTLPGLLSEIMNKRMSYEELCNAVLPHWPNLRKHNGERYAYSSHSQAVLDCLRNRSEWARLVDRGPKTNAGRKRRRSDAEAPSFESEDNEGNKKKTVKCVESKSCESLQDQFPKGKRKARKRRRRLALQGRGIKDVVRRRSRFKEADDAVSYDEDICSPSNSSSGESMFSEDEIQGLGGTCAAAGRCEASASSEEQ